ncbi:uncharacterized protein SEPMUDRAFT_148412 [Sphaerulina musiva SO2202]|uniref:RING-type E3 ubiquitin transferase n=1 Tax=Sphaerulina musiva (strain SO2202) TaxID=692275 RepID=M3B4W0_SPHMS|nr:uncharacterized protein SEPMUDRAFT_148412 [Sphaerulina musiva SO2202]EMF14822.1 hypothetical protein SEPMUDRAFT_148412 [Sphaerulina musiva SO2202]
MSRPPPPDIAHQVDGDDDRLNLFDFLHSAAANHTLAISRDQSIPEDHHLNQHLPESLLHQNLHQQQQLRHQHHPQHYHQQQHRSARQPPQTTIESASADRKRRHTGSDHTGRSHPHPSYLSRGPGAGVSGDSGRSTAQQAGTSVEHAIVLTSSPSPPPPPSARPTTQFTHSSMENSNSNSSSSNNNRNMGSAQPQTSQDSDALPPRWQPDNDVSQCPVCDTDFSLLYRRHHCRKCGRVVCARCSPHRITIPRQYIVQPPEQQRLFLFNEESSTDLSDPALGGGEVVRVCNPCVPDPWHPDTSSPPRAPLRPTPRTPGPMFSEPPRASPLPLLTSADADRYLANLRDQRDPERSISMPFGGRNRSQSHQQASEREQRRGSDFARLLPMNSSVDRHSRNHLHYFPQYPHAHEATSRQSHRSLLRDQQAHLDMLSRQHDSMRMARATGENFEPHWEHPPPNTGASPAPPPPRRQVAEEDECPVCGEEMPPGEASREQHVEECIATRMAPSSTSPPPVRPTTTNSAPAEGSRPRAVSFRPRGMVKSVATEKDCVDGDGEPRECSICLEEYEPGVELGRMECLCLFHAKCIREWWEQKGAGACPTPHFD